MRYYCKLQLALGILSGRIRPGNLDDVAFKSLGFSSYVFDEPETPDEDEIRNHAESVILDIFSNLEDRLDVIEGRKES